MICTRDSVRRVKRQVDDREKNEFMTSSNELGLKLAICIVVVLGLGNVRDYFFCHGKDWFFLFGWAVTLRFHETAKCPSSTNSTRGWCTLREALWFFHMS